MLINDSPLLDWAHHTPKHSPTVFLGRAARRTVGRHIADVLARDLDRVHEQIAQGEATERTVSANPDCPHPGWYPVRRLVLDAPYEDSPILAYCCTGCAASRPVVDGGTK